MLDQHALCLKAAEFAMACERAEPAPVIDTTSTKESFFFPNPMFRNTLHGAFKKSPSLEWAPNKHLFFTYDFCRFLMFCVFFSYDFCRCLMFCVVFI